MSVILSLLLNAAVLTTPPAQDAKKVEVTPTQEAKAADCDGKDKTVKALTVDPKALEAKAAEEKALQNLGLKKDEPKAKTGTVVTSAPAMETCK